MRHDLRKFYFQFFVTAFITCILFLTGSLLFNRTLGTDPAGIAVWSAIFSATAVVTLVCAIFLVYVWGSFVKSREAEFQFFLSIGMGARDLQKMLFIEGGFVFVAAAFVGFVDALLLGHLFYFFLARNLNMHENLFYLGYNTFLFWFVVSIIIFVVQQWESMRILRKLSAVVYYMPTKRSVFAMIFRFFPQFYRRKILLLSDFGFRHFIGAIVFSTLLIALAVVFINEGIIRGTYYSGNFDYFQPHHFMVERRGDVNIASHEKLREIVNVAGGEISEIRTLHYLDVDVFRYSEPPPGTFRNFAQKSYLVGAGAFSRFTGQEISVLPGELLIVTNHREAYEAGIYFETQLRLDWEAPDMQFTKPETSIIFLPFVNAHGETFSHASVIHDAVWGNMVGYRLDLVNDLTVFNISHGNHSRIMDNLLNELSSINDLPPGTWDSAVEFSLDRRDDVRQLRPISQAEQHRVNIDSFASFIFTSTGIFSILTAAIVMYHGFHAGIKKETMEMTPRLKSIGMTSREQRGYLFSRGIIMLTMPVIFGLGLGGILCYVQS